MNSRIPIDLSIPKILSRNTTSADDDEAVPEIPVEAYDKIRHWRNKLDRTAKLDKRAVFECAAADLFLEAEYERDRGAVRAISDEIYMLGRDHTGLSDDDIQDIMVGAKGKAEWPSGNSLDDFPLLRDAGEPPKESPTPAPTPEQLPRLPFLDMSRWDADRPAIRQWALHERIPLLQASLFSGEGGGGKSNSWLQECYAHAIGRDWLGMLPEPGGAWFVECEDDEKELHRRARCIADYYETPISEAIKGGFRLISFAGHDAVLATVSKSGKIEPTLLYKVFLEEAGDIKPKMIGIASSANVFAGSENDRSQVQQFVGMLTRIAMAANGAVNLISHPSLTGISTDSGLSGTTQWHNAVRARFYMRSVNPEPGEQPDSDLRELVFKKNNYGPIAHSIVLRYQRGLFLPVPGASSLDRAASEQLADNVFLDLLKRFAKANRNVSDRIGPGYAPAQFAREDEAKRAGVNSKSLEAAMRRLFKAEKIENEPYGRPARPNHRIALKA
jgi:RecA-family ATPase